MQERYDTARELVEAVRGQTTPPNCRPLQVALAAYATANVAASEAFDRLRPRGPAETKVRAADTQVRRLASTCPEGTLRPLAAPASELLEPRTGEAFYGLVRTRTPRTATRAELRSNGQLVRAMTATYPETRTTLALLPSRYELEVRFYDSSGRSLATARSQHAWLLPATATGIATGEQFDRQLEASLAAIANGFNGYSAIWISHLSTGSQAGWNQDARFPAASTVKLGVLVAALRRYGPTPERTSAAYDLQQLAAWSSNLAANRLFELLGNGNAGSGVQIVERTLRQMGATSSTYPGEYRAGTAHRAATPNQPPLISQRTTTAHDLGTTLATLHRSALGEPDAQARSGLTTHEARLALALLLDSEPSGDNIGLFYAALPANMPAAQKQGWLTSAFHTAAILYTPSGPVVCVLLTYRDGLTRQQATALGGRVVALALRPSP